MKHKKKRAVPLASLVHKLIHNFIRPICFIRYPLTDVRDSNRTNITALFLCIIVPTEGFEPSTLGLKILCSATELRKRKGMVGFAPTPPWLPSQVLYYWATFLIIRQKYLWCKGDSNSPNPQWKLIYSQSSLTAWISHHLWNTFLTLLCCPKRIRTTNDRTKTCSVAITP